MNWDLHILYTCLCYVCFYYVCFYYMCLKCIWSLETQRNWGRLYHKRRWTSNSFQTWIWVGGTTTGDGIHLRRDGIRFEEFVSGPSRTLFIWDTQMNLSGLYQSRRWDSFEVCWYSIRRVREWPFKNSFYLRHIWVEMRYETILGIEFGIVNAKFLGLFWNEKFEKRPSSLFKESWMMLQERFSNVSFEKRARSLFKLFISKET